MPSRFLRRLDGLSLVVGATSALVLYLLVRIWTGDRPGSELIGFCKNEPFQVLPHPEERFSAVAFTRSCGATTGFGTMISFTSERDHAFGPGSVFRAEWAEHGPAVEAGHRAGPPVRMQWLALDSLQVIYHESADLFFVVTRYGRTDIVCRSAPLPPENREVIGLHSSERSNTAFQPTEGRS